MEKDLKKANVKSVIVEMALAGLAIGAFFLLKGTVDDGKGLLSYSVMGYYSLLMVLIGIFVVFGRSFISKISQVLLSGFAYVIIPAGLFMALPWGLWLIGVMTTNYAPNMDPIAVFLTLPVYIGLPFLVATTVNDA